MHEVPVFENLLEELHNIEFHIRTRSRNTSRSQLDYAAQVRYDYQVENRTRTPRTTEHALSEYITASRSQHVRGKGSILRLQDQPRTTRTIEGTNETRDLTTVRITTQNQDALLSFSMQQRLSAIGSSLTRE